MKILFVINDGDARYMEYEHTGVLNAPSTRKMKTANYINIKKLYEIHDLLAYLYNALEHNDMSEQSQKIEEAINLLNKVKKGVFCNCNKPERKGKKENVCAVCGKFIELNYFG